MEVVEINFKEIWTRKKIIEKVMMNKTEEE